MIKQGRKDLSPDILEKLIRCFEQFKAEDDERLEDDNVFVRTSAFTELMARQDTRINTVLLGRKGDGKTALLRRLAHDLRHNGDQPSGERSAEVFHQIDMEETYFTELINKFQLLSNRIRNDHPNIPTEQIAKKLWTKFLVLAALQVASQSSRDLIKTGRLPTGNDDAMATLQTRIAAELGTVVRPNTADVSQSFVGYLSGLLRKIGMTDRSLANALTDAETNSYEPLEALRDLPETFRLGALQIGSSRLHLTLALDRFDDFIDRLVSNDLSTTRQLRRHFLHGLVSALYELRKHQAFGWLRVIASLPDDLVIDLDLREIASHKRMLFVYISWSIEDLRNILDNRVSSVLPGSTWGDLFPFQVSNANRKVQRKEAANDYLIRHTTRRPRELMAHALGLFLHLRSTGKPIDAREMNRVVAKTNREIVDTQVIPEWQTVMPTLKSFIERMHRSEPKTVFSYSEVQQWGTTVALVRGSLPDDVHVPDETRTFMALSSLYRVGMIGFRVRRTTPRPGYLRQGDNDWARYIFSYSGLTEPIGDVTSLLLSPKLQDVVDTEQGKAVRALLAEAHQAKYDISLCFSPMFFESLSADHDFTFVVDEALYETES